MPKDVNPEFEHEFLASGPGDLRDPAPDQIAINDEPPAREDLSDEEWIEVRTRLLDFISAARELPLDDGEASIEPDEVSDDYESMPAYHVASDVTSVQSRTLFGMLDQLEQTVIRERPDRQRICNLVQGAVVELEVVGFTLMAEPTLSEPLEDVAEISRWWTLENSIREPEDVDPALERDVDINVNQPRPTV